LKDRLFVALQYVLPQHGLSRLIHRATRVRATWFKDAFIRVFVRLFDVDLAESNGRAPGDFESFNAFFTRSLVAGARPMPDDPAAIASPVDGTVSQAGAVAQGTLLQAKGFRYGLADLLGDPPDGAGAAAALAEGVFATIYLAPYNYHRIHMPVTGTLRAMRYVPGRLFSVNGATVAAVPRLFARNERVVCLFDTTAGPLAMVLVGALNVGSIETVWAGEVAPARVRAPREWHYGEDAVTLERGAEMGRFNMGSTVILVAPGARTSLDADLQPGRTLRVGEGIGALRAQATDAT
jgi:phosphatidylserine decarboxylase